MVRFRAHDKTAVVNVHTELPTPSPDLYPAHACPKQISREFRGTITLIRHTTLQGRRRPRAREETPRSGSGAYTLLHVTVQKLTLLEKLSTKADINVIHPKENLKEQVILYHT